MARKPILNEPPDIFVTTSEQVKYSSVSYVKIPTGGCHDPDTCVIRASENAQVSVTCWGAMRTQTLLSNNVRQDNRSPSFVLLYLPPSRRLLSLLHAHHSLVRWTRKPRQDVNACVADEWNSACLSFG